MISVTEKSPHYTFANMDKIPSFKINHKLLKQGIYVSRTDEPNITTYDIRVIEPSDAFLDDIVPDLTHLGQAFHTIEHWGATYFRSKSCEFSKDVIYFGPMGCLTGFYLILKGTHIIKEVWEETRKMFITLTATQSIPGATEEECGRYTFHDLDSAKRIAWYFLNVLNAGPDPERTTYPIGRVLFLCAMEEEAKILRDEKAAPFKKIVEVVGIGKVNAAVNAAMFIEKYNPNYVVSFGYAGGIQNNMIKKKDLIVGDRVFYHDVWCGEPNLIGQVQGCPQYFDCAENRTILNFIVLATDIIPRDTARVIHDGTIATGDSFVTKKEEAQRIKQIYWNTLCVDMESAAIAQVCYGKKIPFMAYKMVSDIIGEEKQVENYDQTVHSGGEICI